MPQRERRAGKGKCWGTGDGEKRGQICRGVVSLFFVFAKKQPLSTSFINKYFPTLFKARLFKEGKAWASEEYEDLRFSNVSTQMSQSQIPLLPK